MMPSVGCTPISSISGMLVGGFGRVPEFGTRAVPQILRKRAVTEQGHAYTWKAQVPHSRKTKSLTGLPNTPTWNIPE